VITKFHFDDREKGRERGREGERERERERERGREGERERESYLSINGVTLSLTQKNRVIRKNMK